MHLATKIYCFYTSEKEICHDLLPSYRREVQIGYGTVFATKEKYKIIRNPVELVFDNDIGCKGMVVK